VFDFLKISPHLEAGQQIDPRLNSVTVRHLLNHTAGWGNTIDHMADGNRRAARTALGVTEDDMTPVHMVRFMFGRPLDSDPGTKMVYSNFGYCVLGRVIENVSGQSYEDYIKQNVLKPIGIASMQIGARTPADGESHYYNHVERNGSVVRERFTDASRRASVHMYESHGGWIASAVDLVRFACAFDNPRTCRILSPPAIEAMFSRPVGPPGINSKGQPKNDYYAFAWEVRNKPSSRTLWHSGSLAPGTWSMLYRRDDGVTWAVLFNLRTNINGETLRFTVQTPLHEAADNIRQLRLSPRFDLFRTTCPPARR